MKIKISLLMMLLILPVFSDWKKDLKTSFESKNGYPAVIEILEKVANSGELKGNELVTALGYLSYCHDREKNQLMRKKYLVWYFVEKSDHEIIHDLFPDVNSYDKEYYKTIRFLTKWTKIIPQIKSIEIAPNNKIIKKFTTSQTLKLLLNLQSKSGEVEIKKGEINLYKGIVSSGTNEIIIPIYMVEPLKKINIFEMNVINSDITLKAKFMIQVSDVLVPEGIVYDIRKDKVTYKGEELRPLKINKIEEGYKTEFNKKKFKRSVLPKLLAGLGSMLIGELLKNSVENSSGYSSTHFLYSSQKTASFFGVSLSLVSLLDLKNCFKRKHYRTVRAIDNPGANIRNMYVNKIREKMLNKIELILQLEYLGGRYE